MTEEELAALAIALDALAPQTLEAATPAVSRWKLAARMPDLDMEDLRVLH